MPNNNNGARCGTCKFYIANPQDLRQGFCRKAPPQVFMVPQAGPAGQMQINFVWQWPPTREEQWCGEWRSRLVQ